MSWQLRDWIRLLVIEGIAVIILVFVFWWLSRRKPATPSHDEQCVPPPSKPVPVPAVLPAGVPHAAPPPPVPPVSEAVTPTEAVAPVEREVTSTGSQEEVQAAAVTYAGWGATAAALPAEEVAAAAPAVPLAEEVPTEAQEEAPAAAVTYAGWGATAEAPMSTEEVAFAAPAVPPQPDDLTIMEGIGPKIASVLAAAGVTTFAQLAAADVDWLREVMLAAGLRLADPTTWPEQSRLAAAGDWEGLKALQGQLKGGRRVK